MLEIQEMQLEKNNDDPNTQPRCNQDKIELDERYFIEMQQKGAGLQIALQLGSTDRSSAGHLESLYCILSVSLFFFVGHYGIKL